MDVRIEDTWKNELKDEFQKAYFQQIISFIKAEKSLGKVIYPPGPLIFNAFQKTPFPHVKVIILGQDPYHNPGQAHGLSFSVPEGVPKPPSLVNIYKELYADVGVTAKSGNLEPWAERGVFLLNASLTVRKNEPASHSKIGWLEFTDAIIKKLSNSGNRLIFILWGKFAQDKQALIDETRHHVLKAAHPSPFSADKGFFGCKHFSKTNQILTSNGLEPIDWNL